MKLLLIEDEKQLADSILDYLKQEGYRCEWACDYFSAEEKAGLYQYDIVLVDITLPGGNGLKIIDQLKKSKSGAGIIIISAKNSLDDKINGLDLGADDYITKPFHLSELNSRIKSLLRRRLNGGSNLLECGDITIDPSTRQVEVKGNPIDLTRKEYDLLLYFIINKNRVLAKEAIAEHLWGDNMDMAESYDFIYSHIKNLRKKILEKGGGDHVKTVYGMGYKFVSE
jgi:DNA-binding response OmpR family regulator